MTDPKALEAAAQSLCKHTGLFPDGWASGNHIYTEELRASWRDKAVTAAQVVVESYLAALSATAPNAAEPVAWPEPKITNPDIADITGVPYIDGLIHQVLDAQQDLNFEANYRMSQSLADASALLDEIERALRFAATIAAPPIPSQAVAPSGDLVTLAECPIGLFYKGDELCLKTEYGNNEGRIDAYIVSSGEFFWGGTSKPADQRKVLVCPADVIDPSASNSAAKTGEA